MLSSTPVLLFRSSSSREKVSHWLFIKQIVSHQHRFLVLARGSHKKSHAFATPSNLKFAMSSKCFDMR